MSCFADMLCYLRKREGLSQQDLAYDLGVAKSSISMYENGQRKPSYEMLELIADYFNVNMDTLTGYSGAIDTSTEHLSEEELKLLTLSRQLNPEGREKLIDYADDLVRSEKYTKSDPSDLGQEA